MDHLVATCSKCNRQFNIVKQEQDFLRKKELPNPNTCPSCRQTRRLSLRGAGRQLFKATCKQCGKQIIVAFDPQKFQNTVLCREHYDKFFAENDPIITDPLPEN